MSEKLKLFFAKVFILIGTILFILFAFKWFKVKTIDIILYAYNEYIPIIICYLISLGLSYKEIIKERQRIIESEDNKYADEM